MCRRIGQLTLDEAIRYLNRRILPSLEVFAERATPGACCEHPFDTDRYAGGPVTERGSFSAGSICQSATDSTGTRKSWKMLTVEKGLLTKKLWPGRRARSSSEQVNLFRFTAVTSTTRSWRYGNWNRNGQPPVVSSAARKIPTN
jgi:hypothetical protein